MTTVAFDYNDFNPTTSRSHDCRKHGIADLRRDHDGLFYVHGSLGCGKIRPTIHEAMREYLGGRELLAYRVFD